jgi:hypothetical protein
MLMLNKSHNYLTDIMPLARREELQGMRNFLVYILSQGGYPRAYQMIELLA